MACAGWGSVPGAGSVLSPACYGEGELAFVSHSRKKGPPPGKWVSLGLPYAHQPGLLPVYWEMALCPQIHLAVISLWAATRSAWQAGEHGRCGGQCIQERVSSWNALVLALVYFC